MTSHAPMTPARAGDDAAADAVAVRLRVAEDAFDVQLAGGRRGPAADGGVGGVARVAAGGVEQHPADRRIGQRVAALPGVFDELRQRLKLDGARRLVDVPQPNCQVS